MIEWTSETPSISMTALATSSRRPGSTRSSTKANRMPIPYHGPAGASPCQSPVASSHIGEPGPLAPGGEPAGQHPVGGLPPPAAQLGDLRGASRSRGRAPRGAPGGASGARRRTGRTRPARGCGVASSAGGMAGSRQPSRSSRPEATSRASVRRNGRPVAGPDPLPVEPLGPRRHRRRRREGAPGRALARPAPPRAATSWRG